MKAAIVLGTRPEIIKLAPIIKKLGTKNCSVIFTGQHFDYQMGMQFIHQLGLPNPKYSLKIAKNNPSLQISEIIAKLSKILLKEKPDTVIGTVSASLSRPPARSRSARFTWAATWRGSSAIASR